MKEIIKKIPFDTILAKSLKMAAVAFIATFFIAYIVYEKTVNGYYELVYASLHSADPFSVSLYSLKRHLYFSLTDKVILITMIVFYVNFCVRSIQYFILIKNEGADFRL